MGKSLKVVLTTLFVSLVVFAAIADSSIAVKLMDGLNLALYLRLVALLGLIIAVFLAWGYKRKLEASQKYVHAQEILDQAGEKAERTKRQNERMAEKLKVEYDQKKMGLDEHILQMKHEYEERIRGLKEQNIELKESVGKLMHLVKKNKVH